jgi:hypothetical protein
MLPLLIPLITTAISTAGNLYGQSQSQKAQARTDAALGQRMNDLDSVFNKNYYQDYLDTDVARSAISRMNTQMKDSATALRNSAVAGGATPEAVIAGQGELQKRYNEALGNMAGMGTQYKDNMLNRHDILQQSLFGQKYNALQQQVNKWGNFQSNVTNASNGILGAWAYGAFDKQPGGTNPVTGLTNNQISQSTLFATPNTTIPGVQAYE